MGLQRRHNVVFNFNIIFNFAYTSGYGLFSLILMGSAMFGATFNLVARVGLP